MHKSENAEILTQLTRAIEELRGTSKGLEETIGLIYENRLWRIVAGDIREILTECEHLMRNLVEFL